MAKSTHGLIPVTDAGPIEVGPMGIHPQARLGRMTAQTIRLLVTRNTALQILKASYCRLLLCKGMK